MLAFLLPALATGALVRGAVRGGQDPVYIPGPCEKCRIENLCAGQVDPKPGTAECMPVVCRAVCECRQGLPEPPEAPPIAILPPPPPVWTDAQTVKFCACVGVRATQCGTQHCRDKIKTVMEIVQCSAKTPNANLVGSNSTA